ncbi:hypothetical protein GYH30_041199 [Glycine max]|nr:hypothetical protein GYH30_041199 [Glycine max]
MPPPPHRSTIITVALCSNLRRTIASSPPSWPSPCLWSRLATSSRRSHARLLRSPPAPSSSREVTATPFIVTRGPFAPPSSSCKVPSLQPHRRAPPPHACPSFVATNLAAKVYGIMD